MAGSFEKHSSPATFGNFLFPDVHSHAVPPVFLSKPARQELIAELSVVYTLALTILPELL